MKTGLFTLPAFPKHTLSAPRRRRHGTKGCSSAVEGTQEPLQTAGLSAHRHASEAKESLAPEQSKGRSDALSLLLRKQTSRPWDCPSELPLEKPTHEKRPATAALTATLEGGCHDGVVPQQPHPHRTRVPFSPPPRSRTGDGRAAPSRGPAGTHPRQAVGSCPPPQESGHF